MPEKRQVIASQYSSECLPLREGPRPKTIRKSPLVDAVRGISILLVMLFHFDMYYFSCFDQLALGCLTAIFFRVTRRWFETSRWAISVPILGAFMAACGYFWGGWRENIIFAPSFIALGTALLLIGNNSILPPIFRFLRGGFPLLSSLGRRSYEIYLFHLIVIQFMWIVSADLKLNLAFYSPLWLIVFLLLAYAVAYVIFRFWSEPTNHWIRSVLQTRPDRRGLNPSAVTENL